ncbi:hypothetical protein [Yinghuangia soli]|uniref:Asp23/Gls24 family envelope stress response protein n=1 Tax=Yinghuangia soli TaxID=2908204 RepID=A0AA41U2L1_9ACTN|nr:hypothetical protein [Yinghuangia soli]MCF2527219.1 hypothetical protein [Yinghuangia soli]
MALEPPPTPDDADDEVLPCGASLAGIWDAGQPPVGHGACPHCRAAAADTSALHELVAEAAAPGGTTDAARHADFAARVMDVVRTELRPGPLLPLGTPAAAVGGESGDPEDVDEWITEAAAARVLRAAAEREPGVWAGSCRIRAASAPARAHPGQRLPREPLRVRIEVAVASAPRLTDTAEQVRRRVLDAADRELGIDVAAVDVAVVELRDEPPTASPRRAPR